MKKLSKLLRQFLVCHKVISGINLPKKFWIRPYSQHCCNQSNLASSVKHIFTRVLPPVQGVKGKLLEPLQGEQGGQLLQQPPLQQTPLLPVELLLHQDLAGLCWIQVPVILIKDRIFDTRFQDRTIRFTKSMIHRYKRTDKRSICVGSVSNR